MNIALPPTAFATWAKVEDGFYVGSRNGEFLGYVDQEPSGRYIASDMFSQVIGEFETLSAALRAVDHEPLDVTAPEEN